jgi:hypothetical protein
MLSIFEKEPLFLLERTWDDKTKILEKHKFSRDLGKKAKVYMDSGSLGMEFFYEKTLLDFCRAGDKFQWSWSETFSKFENVLTGSYKTAWREVVQDHFTPLPKVSKDEFKKSFFCCPVLHLHHCRQQNAPGPPVHLHGTWRRPLHCKGPPDAPTRAHEVVQGDAPHRGATSPGKQHPPSKKLVVQWYYMSYHCSDHTEYVKSSKSLCDEILESLMAYFQALFAQKRADSSLERAKLDRIHN